MDKYSYEYGNIDLYRYIDTNGHGYHHGYRNQHPDSDSDSNADFDMDGHNDLNIYGYIDHNPDCDRYADHCVD
jgi:hypothetical protein